MKNRTKYPKVKNVTPQPNKRLLVEFENGEIKVYDCTPLLQHEDFKPLYDEVLFRCAKPDPHGYGVIWNDEIDLAESEIWIKGETTRRIPASEN